MFHVKHFAATLLALVLTLSPALAAEGPTAFSDVPADAWYAPYVEVCVEAGLMKGAGVAKFSPDSTITVAECHVIAARLYGILRGGDGSLDPTLEVGPEYEIPDGAWYGDSVRFLSTLPGGAEAVYSGYYDTPAARMALFGLLALVTPEEALTPINQIDALPDSANPKVLRFYNAGVLSGVDGAGSFARENTLSRAEAAAMLARILEPGLRLRFSLDDMPLPDLFSGLPGTVVRLEVPSASPLIAGAQADLFYTGANNRWTAVNWDGNILFPPAYDDISLYAYQPDGLLTVRRDGLWGCVDRQGREVIPCAYEEVSQIHDGVILAGSKDEGYLIFDAQGNQTGRIPAGRTVSTSTDGGLIRYQDSETGLYGCLNPDGSVAIPAAWASLASFHEGRARVMDPNTHRYGFIDTAGRVAVPATYGEADSFSGGLCVVSNEDILTWEESGGPHYGAVDPQGNLVIPMAYGLLKPFSDGMAAFARETEDGVVMGYLSADGTEHPFDCGRPGWPSDFSHGYANFYEKSDYGYQNGFVWKEGLVDTELNVVLPARFDLCIPGPDGRVLLKDGDYFYLLTLEN